MYRSHANVSNKNPIFIEFTSFFIRKLNKTSILSETQIIFTLNFCEQKVLVWLFQMIFFK
ncbi:hypothetical protein B9T35_08295 [Acinetobacter sp. ANC 3832]|nr:hypothetical protein B9T35_08295 [Acinetobacter sp. ANC 3832]